MITFEQACQIVRDAEEPERGPLVIPGGWEDRRRSCTPCSSAADGHLRPAYRLDDRHPAVERGAGVTVGHPDENLRA